MKQAYPLNWPVGYKRTSNRIDSKFKQSLERAQWEVVNELKRMGVSDVIISTNLRIRKDGGLYTEDLVKIVPDPGVAVYFTYKKKEISMCCDRYRRVWENIYALAKGIEALRGMERWGVSDFLDRAFSGFAALPAGPAKKDWWEVLLCSPDASEEHIKNSYRLLAKKYHPDTGSVQNADMFNEVADAYREAMKHFQPA
jgi:hypothetical protein